MHSNDLGIVGGVLTITAVSPGAVEYLLHGSGCVESEHAPEASVGRTADAVGYLLAGAEKEPAGVWFGGGLPLVGVQEGVAATADEVRAVFGRLEHPSQVDAQGRALALGSRPRSFRSREERVAAALALEPDAAEERRAEIERMVVAQTRTPVAYFDLTFSPAKSVSVYWTALLVAGRRAEAANVVAAHRAGVAAAMAYVEREAAEVRSGYHGRTVSGESVGVHEQATGLVWVRWDHSTSRARQPHLHSHVTVLNRAETASDGAIRALASRGFGPIKQGVDAIYRSVLQDRLSRTNGVVFATRPDGKAEEILGFDSELLVKASARNTAVVARRDALVAEFVEGRGRVPSPAEMKVIDRAAWRETRQAKDGSVSPRRQIERWAAGVRPELTAALNAAVLHADHVAVMGHPDQHGYTGRSRDQVLAAAVAAVQARFAAWDVGNLVAAIVDEQRRTPSVAEPAEDLAGAVLKNAPRYGIQQLSLRDVGVVPDALRRPDGASWFRPRNAVRYATDAQLATEARIVARAVRTDARAVPLAMHDAIGQTLTVAGLSASQRDAVLAIVSSGRTGDVLIGPAGAGKSRTVGALAQVWRWQTGGRVIGLATSQIATRVLAEDGLAAMNTTVFRHRFTPDAEGRVRARLRPDDLVVVDEAGMSGTAELDMISALVTAAGAKMVYTGDHEQLGSVDAGGMLELLARDAGAVELTEIHRFAHDWERAASVRLRAGDPEVLALYDLHGRIRGGAEAEMAAAAVRGYLADVLEDRQPLLIVGNNAAAAELSAQIREGLVAAGRVSTRIVGLARDGNLVGVGDLVQARRNARQIPVGRRTVTNREVYEVLRAGPRPGSLVVRDAVGSVAHLPAGYIRRHVTLAYAVTDHAAEGLTVGTSHKLVDRGTDRAGLYTSGTRGRDANTFYVVCRATPDHHDPQPLDRTPLEVLSAILTRPRDTTAAAELQRRAGEQESRSLAWVGTQWDLLTARHSRDHTTEVLTALLGADTVARLVAEPGLARLMSAIRGLELAGHDPTRVLVEAVGRGSLHDAVSLADVLRFRLHRLGDSGRVPERVTRDGDWGSYCAPWSGPIGDYVGVLAAAATARQAELGEQAATHPPRWAMTASALGPVPDAPRDRAEWVRRVGIIAAYRELHAVPDEQNSIGPAPSREREFHHDLWHRARAALGRPADSLDYSTATEEELREMREVWRREQTWAPRYVADDLRDARLTAEEYRRDAVIWRQALDRHPVGSAERALEQRDVDDAERLAAHWSARAETLEQVHTARTEWYARTAEVRERAGFAGDELERRGADRDTIVPSGAQQESFTAGASQTGIAGTADTAMSPEQRNEDLPDLSTTEPASSAGTAGERVDHLTYDSAAQKQRIAALRAQIDETVAALRSARAASDEIDATDDDLEADHSRRRDYDQSHNTGQHAGMSY